MLRVACPNCAKSLGLPETAAGKNVKCPQCQQVFQAPRASAKPAVAAPGAQGTAKPTPVEKSNRNPNLFDEAKPYGLREDVPGPEQLKKSAQAEAVDAMVIDAQRTRARNKAWEKVGMPTKFVKRTALAACIFWVSFYLFMLMVIVLANHNMEQAEKTGGYIMSGGVKALPRYLFIQDAVPELKPQYEATRPVFLWLYCTAGLIVLLAIYGLQLAGAESMKKLEGYRLSMTAMIIATLSLNLFGILGLLALMDKGVQYEFRVSARRKEGKVGSELYDEGTDEEESDEEDEEEDEEEEEEKARPARGRK